MKIFILIALAFCLASGINSQNLYFPPLLGNSWDTISPVTLGWCPDEVDTLVNYLEDNSTKAFILLKDGKIAIEKYFGNFTQDSLWYWASAGKSLTAFITGVAQQENYFSIHDPTSQYLGQGWTNCTFSQEEEITILNQLTMTTGLDDNVLNPFCTLDTCLNCIADAGTRWAYHNAPYTLLGNVIENATGKTMNGYFLQKIGVPTGMAGAYFPIGYNNIFLSTPRIMARFGLLVLNNGNWSGNQIMTDMTYFNQMVNTSQTFNESYGYLWWLNGSSSYMLPASQFVFPGSLTPNAPADMISAVGKNGQIINVVPSKNLVLVRMGNSPDTSPVPVNFIDTIWQKLNDVICDTASIASFNHNTKFKIHPNPSFNFTTIILENQHFQEITHR